MAFRKKAPVAPNTITITTEQDPTIQTNPHRSFFRRPESRIIVVLAVVDFALLLLAYLCMLDFNVRSFTPAWLIHNASIRLADLVQLLSGRPMESGLRFFLFRLIMCMLSGAALAGAGAVFQSVFRNQMASPTILGIQAGGGLGAALYILFFVTPTATTITTSADIVEKSFLEQLVLGNMEQIVIVISCFISLFVVVLLSKAAGGGRMKTLPMILCGTVFSSACTTTITMIQTYFTINDEFDTRSDALGTLMTGTFDEVYAPEQLIAMAIPIVLCLVLLTLMGHRLNLLGSSPEEAQTMGINVGRSQLVFLGIATVMTAVVIAFCGSFAFVGLVAPYLCRKLVGNNNRFLIPAAAFFGAGLTLIAFTVAYGIGVTALVNVTLSILGGVVFAIMLFQDRRP